MKRIYDFDSLDLINGFYKDIILSDFYNNNCITINVVKLIPRIINYFHSCDIFIRENDVNLIFWYLIDNECNIYFPTDWKLLIQSEDYLSRNSLFINQIEPFLVYTE